jgi:type IV fimbrial biogenesis protein FimT
MPLMKNRSQGFTLPELMITIALIALLVGIGTPNFREFRRNARLTESSNDLLTAVVLARAEAIKTQRTVSLCASDNVDADEPTCSDDDFRGWIVFQDRNTDCVRDAGEELLRQDGPVNEQVIAAGNASCVTFASTGFVVPDPDGPADGTYRLLFCDDRGIERQAGQDQSAGRGVHISQTGRARVTREVGTGSEFDLSEWGINCQ